MDKHIEALNIWRQIKSVEGCERTVNLLRKDGTAENIKKYSRWVLESQPKIGLTLFQEVKL